MSSRGQGKIRARSRHIWGTVRVGTLFESQFLAHQEEVGPQTESHVVVPAGPAAPLIIPQAQELLAFLEAGFDGAGPRDRGRDRS